MNRRIEFRDRCVAMCVACIACLAGPCAAGEGVEGCEPKAVAARAVDPAGGVETHDFSAAGTRWALRLIRLSMGGWDLQVVDMRDLRELKTRRGDYVSPSFSLSELASIEGPGSILSSAGMTQSLYAPVPEGLLIVGGRLRNQANTLSRILDGVVCVRSDRRVELLSETTAEGRRIPGGARAYAACVHAVQAGPMLVAGNKSLVTRRRDLSVPRVIAAVDDQSRFVLGYATKVSTFDLACALSNSGLRIVDAIALQSDALGGVVAGKDSGYGEASAGAASVGIASALRLQRRATPTKR